MQASCDGTWQTMESEITGGNCIDSASILPSSVVPGNTGKRQPPILQTSQDIYATGSAGAIQAVGAAQIFERSVEQNKLRCITY